MGDEEAGGEFKDVSAVLGGSRGGSSQSMGEERSRVVAMAGEGGGGTWRGVWLGRVWQ